MIHLKSLIPEWTGEKWSACSHWKSHRAQFLSGASGYAVTIMATDTMFVLQYRGPGSGVAMAHASQGGGDTLHQLWNVLICELNPRLMAKKLKPVIGSISTSCEKVKSDFVYTIQVPLVADSEPWQINHRGHWGKTDPGAAQVKLAAPKSDRMEGPVRYEDAIPNSNSIYTYVVTYPLADAK